MPPVSQLLRELEREARLLVTHDTGTTGAERLLGLIANLRKEIE
jgi:hypothetical protein